MCLPKILVLEAFGDFVDYRHKNEIKKDPEDHTAPVAGIWGWGADADDNYKE